MKRGPKTLTADEKSARGTLQPVRAVSAVQVIEPSWLPRQRDWLTADGRSVWLDNIGRVSSVRGAAEVDSDLFANFCNLQGAIVAAWRDGKHPHVTALMEARKLMEMLRIAGPGSRAAKVGDGGDKAGSNPFNRPRA